MRTFFKFWLIIILFPIQLLADGPFLYSLPFNVYPEESILVKTPDNGIDYKSFEEYLLNDQNELGKKVALVSGLEVYFIINSDKKSYFIEYKDKFKQSVEKKYKTSVNNSETPIDLRFIYTLMNDYDTESPKIEEYQKFVKENPQSRTMQTVNVFAFNFNLIWDEEKRDYKSLNDFKENYLDNYFMNFDSMEDDVPADVLIRVQEISNLGYNCGYHLKCLVADKEDLVKDLEIKTAFLQHKIANAEPIPMMMVAENASEIGLKAYQWLGSQAQMIQDLKVSDNEKALLNYFVVNETYQFINHIDNLSVYHEAISKTEDQLSKMKLPKADATFLDFKKEFEKGNNALDFGGSSLDSLRNLVYYLYQNPKELFKIYKN